MALGRKSIYQTLLIYNSQNISEPHKIVVQANKNFAICDIIPRVGNVLNYFQGQQINDSEVMNQVYNAIDDVINHE